MWASGPSRSAGQVRGRPRDGGVAAPLAHGRGAADRAGAAAWAAAWAASVAAAATAEVRYSVSSTDVVRNRKPRKKTRPMAGGQHAAALLADLLGRRSGGAPARVVGPVPSGQSQPEPFET